MRVILLKINSNVCQLENTNSHYFLLNTTVILLYNGNTAIFCSFILIQILFHIYTFKKFKFKFYHSIKGYTFSFWSCYIRYALLIIDQFPVEFSLFRTLFHLSLETSYRFIHLRPRTSPRKFLWGGAL